MSDILSARNLASLGRSFATLPQFSNGGETTIIRSVGERLSVSAVTDRGNPEVLSLMATAFPLSMGEDDIWSNLYLRLKVRTSGDMFGEIQDPIPTPMALPLMSNLEPYIKIDAIGAVVSIPTAMLVGVDWQQIAINDYHPAQHTAAVWPVGKQIGPHFRINAAFGRNSAKSVQSWYSDVPAFLDTAADDSAMWARPQLAEAIRFDVILDNPFLAIPTGELTIKFFTESPAALREVRISPPFGGSALIAWPNNAFYVAAVNNTNMNMHVFPVNAIRI